MSEQKLNAVMPWICDHCGDETTIIIDPDNLQIDPPYFCPACDRALLDEEPSLDEDPLENDEDDFFNPDRDEPGILSDDEEDGITSIGEEEDFE
jgi:hypothetical protein